MWPLRAILVITFAATSAAPISAQNWGVFGPPAIEAVAAVTTSSNEPDDPFLFFDLAATMPMGSRFGAIVRPYAHRLSGGEWAAEMYQLQLRYQSQTRIPVRIDAGIITSPLGLGTLELRPDLSPAIKPPFYYHMPLPPFEPRYDGVQLMSGGYPLGALVSVSGARWDARAGITDSTPARSRNVFSRQEPDAMRQIVLGGGITPVPGLRFGGGFAHGAYRSSSTPTPETEFSSPGADVTVLNVESEYAVGHTRISGEWVRNRFESPLGPAVTRGYFVQAVRTFGPRIFSTIRIARASSPVYTVVSRERRSMMTTEVSAGYRMGRDLTVRGGYYASRRFGALQRNHAAVVSLVWARRWF